MGKLFENFWYYYQEEYCSAMSEEEKEILDILIVNEEKLRASLTDEEKNSLKIYENCMSDLLCIAERRAFVEGVRFMTDFLLEALRGGNLYERKEQS